MILLMWIWGSVIKGFPNNIDSYNLLKNEKIQFFSFFERNILYVSYSILVTNWNYWFYNTTNSIMKIMSKDLIVLLVLPISVYSSYQIDFGLGVLSQFRIRFYVYIDFLHNWKFMFKFGQINFDYKIGWISNPHICFEHL